MDDINTNSLLLSIESPMKQHILKDAEEDEEESLTIDEFLDHVGHLGLFQIIVLLLLSFISILAGFKAFLMVFANPEHQWKCSNVNKDECNSTVIFSPSMKNYGSRCSMNRSSWEYVSPANYYLATEFDLVCSREALSHVANSALFMGQIIFGFPMAYVSDRYGRKRVLSSAFITLCIFSFLSSFSPNIWVLILLRTLCGGCFVGIMITIVVVSLELVGPKYRTFAGLIFWNAWTVGLCLLSLQSWLVPEWKTLTKITSAPYLIFALGFLFIPESVRWYRSQNRTREAENVLRKVAKYNKKSFPKNKYLEPIGDHEKVKASYKDLFLSWSEGLKTLTLCWMWFTNDLNYYGIAMASGDFGGNLHRDFVLFSLCEIPANMFCIWFLNKIGRKKGAILGYVVTSSSLICFGLLQHYNVQILALRVTLGMIAKMFNIISWAATEVWSGELYSTIVRSQAIGLFFITSQLGSAVSPWIAMGLKHYSTALPFFIFGGFPFIAGFIALHLQETLGKDIDDAVQDLEDRSAESVPIADITA